jgi:non-ribosomal peptide synthetase-like protein
MERRLTHDPGPLRCATRVFWELLRFALPVPPLVVTLLWVAALARFGAGLPAPALLLFAAPAASALAAALLCLAVWILKWGLLGRVRPGLHPLWSCWCSRWDFLYVAWGFWARGILANLAGTGWCVLWLRAMGCHVGRGVILGPGFAQVVDPDMLEFEDGCTVNGMFQAHSFEDRVLKIDRVRIRAGASVSAGSVLLYGADVGAGARLAPHGVVMKRERLSAGLTYVGCPVRAVEAGSPAQVLPASFTEP